MSSKENIERIVENIIASAKLVVNEPKDLRIFGRFYDLNLMNQVVQALENRNDHLGVIFAGCEPTLVSVMLPKGN